MDKEKFLNYYEGHKGEVIGTGIGLIFALVILLFGFWKVLFLALCGTIGFYFGKKYFEDGDYFRQLFEKIKSFIKEK